MFVGHTHTYIFAWISNIYNIHIVYLINKKNKWASHDTMDLLWKKIVDTYANATRIKMKYIP